MLNSVIRYSGSVHGTRPFWGAKRQGLESMVRGLGCPGTFITLSAADLHWDSLHKHMPRYNEWKVADGQRKYAISMASLKDSPHIAAYHFHFRFDTFLGHVLKPKFRITDYWYRYEWQARGSTHMHGLFWVDGSPASQLTTEAMRESFAQFWGNTVTALNPAPVAEGVVSAGLGNPLANTDNPPTFLTIAEIINRVQRHKCSDTYCMRRRGISPFGALSSDKSRRFYYPRPTHTAPIVTNTLNKQYWTVDGACNDPILNNYNKTISFGWPANHDISPCTSVHAVVNYISK